MTKKNKVWLCIFAAFVLFGLFSTSSKPETTLPRETVTPITTPYITTTPEPIHTPEPTNTPTPTIIPVITYTITTPEPTEEPTEEPTSKPTEEFIWEDEEFEKKEDMVYIPEKGEKYHRRSKCGNSNKMKQISREEAIKQGYEPCGKCY